MTQTVQTNGIQSLSKTWELSLYELQRTPQVSLVHCEKLNINPMILLDIKKFKMVLNFLDQVSI